ncbi:MAG: hypothetical protein ACLFV7_12285, partial [Phycisphaerae bacterium]
MRSPARPGTATPRAAALHVRTTSEFNAGSTGPTVASGSMAGFACCVCSRPHSPATTAESFARTGKLTPMLRQ